jgi:Na+-translocating ferredoxin:NAD+ oxidoreductase RnfG subunit
MKTIFNFVSLALVLLLWAAPRRALADETHFTSRQLLKEFFPKSKRVTYLQITPDAKQRERIRARLGYTPAKATYTFFVAMTDDKVDGYAFVDDELGQHLPITYGVKISPAGAVEIIEIMVYRESRGDEVRDPRFRKQFVGKTGHDAIRLNQDVVAISGATISSNSMAVGVKRAVVLFEECVSRHAVTEITAMAR